MRACYVISGLGTGGAELALLRLCHALKKRTVEATVVSVSDNGDLGARFQQAGIEVLALNMHRPDGVVRAAGRMKSHLLKCRPHLVHGWMYHGNLIATLLGRIDGEDRAVLWSVRQSLIGNKDTIPTRLAIRLGAFLSQRPSAISYNSQVARIQHEATGFHPRMAYVIPNGFDFGAFHADDDVSSRVRSGLGIDADCIVVGHVARFHPSKDHVGFLRAFARLSTGRRHVRAVLAGRGVDAMNISLRSLIASLGLTDRVSLLGLRTDIPALMAAFDVFCSSSNGMEGFPNVVAEAMCCEVPCVATGVGDAGVIVSEHGEVVRPSDEAALASALARIIDLPRPARRAMGRAARKHIIARYSIESVADRHCQLYESLLASRTTRCAE
jgi:glycosyltransferase involved in cell wall biosynthesis